MQIIPLSEGAFTIDTTKQFIPFDVEKDDLQKRVESKNSGLQTHFELKEKEINE